jgi:hypothetical protein
MLNQSSNRRIDQASQWCVGNPPPKWDVSFSAKVAEKLRRIFVRKETERVERPVEMPLLRRAA